MNFTITGPLLGKAGVCLPILNALPEWFGIPASVAQYVTEIDSLPTFLATSPEKVIGVITLKQHYSSSAEIYVMGILPGAHRHGVGRALIQAAQDWLKTQEVEYLQVKTLGPSNSDLNYAGTRDFYEAMGFRPLEEFKHIWDEHNPCLVMIKRL
jgi:ribosomal protein S18 acetylase RimI-like enzyme